MDHLRFKIAIGALLATLVGHTAAQPRALEPQLIAAAREVLDQRADREGWHEPQFELTVLMPRTPPRPCAKPLEIEPVDTRQASRLRLAARCPEAGDAGWEHTFTVKASVSARVVIAATAVPAGKALTENDLRTERRDITALRDSLSDMDAAVGQSSRRALRSGEVVRSGLLSAPVLVKRGDAVRIVAQRDGITVTVAGEAQEAGARGAIVRVRNVGTGKVIRARVIDAGTVQPAEL